MQSTYLIHRKQKALHVSQVAWEFALCPYNGFPNPFEYLDRPLRHHWTPVWEMRDVYPTHTKEVTWNSVYHRKVSHGYVFRLTSRSDLRGHRASTSSKNITQGAEFLARWKTWRTARSLSPTYWNKKGKVNSKNSKKTEILLFQRSLSQDIQSSFTDFNNRKLNTYCPSHWNWWDLKGFNFGRIVPKVIIKGGGSSLH